MPNIELLGFKPKEAKRLVAEIQGSLRPASYRKEVVITTHTSVVVDFDGEKKPYLRISATDMTMVNDVERRLRYLDLDIEMAPLAGFVPKSSDRNFDATCLSAEYQHQPGQESLKSAGHKKVVRKLGDLEKVTASELKRAGCSDAGIALAKRILQDHHLPKLQD